MAVEMSLFVDDPAGGPIDEADLDQGDITALLDPEMPAGIEITAPTGEVIIRDNLEDLMAGVCLDGGKALQSGGSFTNVSFAGFEPAEISTDAGLARFESEGDALSAPVDDCLEALRALAGRYAALLERAFPEDVSRRARFAEFAVG